MREKTVLGGREKVTVAVVQASPVFMDKEKTIEKACKLIKDAGGNGAELIVFPETFIPGYPAIYTGGWESKPSEWAAFMIALQDNSVLIDSEDTENLGEAVKKANAYVVMGCNELDPRPGSRTIYNSLIYFSRDGKIMGRHRKLMPTYTERTYWGWGDASDLQVFDTDIGRIGGLICAEHRMILVKAAMIHKGEELHIAAWPGSWSGYRRKHLMDPETDPQGGTCVIYPAIRAYAWDSQAFVLSASGVLREDDFPEKWAHLKNSDHTNYNWALGGSAIVDPGGMFIAGPSIGEETILYAECHANAIKLAKALGDSLGHYARWDVVRLQVRKEPWSPEAGEGRRLLFGEPTIKELRRLSEQYEVSLDKLEAAIQELIEASSTSG